MHSYVPLAHCIFFFFFPAALFALLEAGFLLAALICSVEGIHLDQSRLFSLLLMRRINSELPTEILPR